MKFQKYTRRSKDRPDDACHTNKKARKSWQEDADKDFRCCQCRQMIYSTPVMGTRHRNHCPYCLWSKHVDTKPGNRQSDCHGRMEPIALTLKYNGYDKYGKTRLGDVMTVHMCRTCGQININRIASDDCVVQLGHLFRNAMCLDATMRQRLSAENIMLIEAADEEVLRTALFGKDTKTAI